MLCLKSKGSFNRAEWGGKVRRFSKKPFLIFVANSLTMFEPTITSVTGVRRGFDIISYNYLIEKLLVVKIFSLKFRTLIISTVFGCCTRRSNSAM
jgi:hypothetical protein